MTCHEVRILLQLYSAFFTIQFVFLTSIAVACTVVKMSSRKFFVGKQLAQPVCYHIGKSSVI